MKPSKLLLILIFISSFVNAQNAINYSKLGDKYYQEKNYPSAIENYLLAIKNTDFKAKIGSVFYNIACCEALQSNLDESFNYLKKSFINGYNDKSNLLKDTDLTILHNDKRWVEIVKLIKEDKKVLNSNPAKAKFITDDIYRFWKAYDAVNKDTTNYKNTFKKIYFDKASSGMNDYMASKVGSINQFISHIKSKPKFYKSIRNTSLEVDNYKKDFLKSFMKMKKLYSNSKFPDVYFVIGAYTSGGTVTKNGLLIGLNQACQTDKTNLEEFNFSDKLLLTKQKNIPSLIAHELIHFQQDGMKNDTITLGYAIKEGMADFIGEQISGAGANLELHKWAVGKEKMIWKKFSKDMYFDRYDKWLANYENASETNFPDQGYWVGYQICKAYYENSQDKKKAINDMLNIQDYQKFLNDSGWENKLKIMK